MILRGPEHINEDMRLKQGDRFLVNVQFLLNEHDDADLMNGYWLTVESVGEEQEFIRPMDTRDDIPGFIHNAYRDEIIEAECRRDTNIDMYWWDMEAIDVRTAPLRPLEEELPNI